MEEMTESLAQTQSRVAQVTAVVPVGATFLRWRLGLKQCRFHPGEQVSRDRSLDGFRPPRFASMLLSRRLSASGKLVDLEPSPRLSRLCQEDIVTPHGARGHVDRSHNSVYVGACRISSGRPPFQGWSVCVTATLALPVAAEEAGVSIRRFQRTLTPCAPLTRGRWTATAFASPNQGALWCGHGHPSLRLHYAQRRPPMLGQITRATTTRPQP